MMTKRKTPDEMIEDYLRGKSPLSRAYRSEAIEEPPRALDKVILDAARHAVHARPRMPRSPFAWHWMVPLSAAAVIMLSVGLLMFMSKEGAVPMSMETEFDASVKAKSETQVTERQDRAPDAPVDQTKPPSPVVASDEADGHESVREAMPLFERTIAGKDAAPQVSASAPVPASRLKTEEPGRLIDKSVVRRSDIVAKQAGVAVNSLANVVSVQVSDKPGAYRFTVAIASPDTGCDRYADWWEVVSEDGQLLYRRVLLHSHVSEQPFARSGGPVPIAPDAVVWVRAHMHPGGYGGAAFKGSVNGGFKKANPTPSFAAELAKQPPLPDDCAF